MAGAPRNLENFGNSKRVSPSPLGGRRATRELFLISTSTPRTCKSSQRRTFRIRHKLNSRVSSPNSLRRIHAARVPRSTTMMATFFLAVQQTTVYWEHIARTRVLSLSTMKGDVLLRLEEHVMESGQESSGMLTTRVCYSRRHEDDDHFLGRVTHLRLQNKRISSLGCDSAFDACPSLKVLYIYDNSLESLKGLERLRNIEQLYVDNNFLTTVDDTLPYRRLTKLHMNGNCLSTLNGLESATCLEELQVARQRLPPGQRFMIHTASIEGIKDSLRILDASGNGMGADEVEPFLELYQLETLNLADNAIQKMPLVLEMVSILDSMMHLDLRGNAVCHTPKYFERVVSRSGDRLAFLDGKPVHTTHREMLRKLSHRKGALGASIAGGVLSFSKADKAAGARTGTIPAPMAGSGLQNAAQRIPEEKERHVTRNKTITDDNGTSTSTRKSSDDDSNGGTNRN